MIVPEPPTIARIESISPTVYEAATHCLARASWAASGDLSALPTNPRALLGIAVHSVLARAARAGIAGADEEERVQEAASHFDEEMSVLFESAHPLIRAKFGNRNRIPFYNIYRARAARIASESSPPPSRGADTGPAGSHGRDRSRLAEPTLTSRDQKIRGRPDLIDVENAVVLDYKTGSSSDSGQPTESEARQLRLYAHLAAENGIDVRAGVVVRADRDRAEIPIPREEAEDEGRRARGALEEINGFSGRRFEEAATPSPNACRYCPCIPFCPAFWKESDPGWADRCGTQLEGVVDSIEGESLVSMRLEVARGTGTRGLAVVSRLSRAWLEVEEANFPQPGQAVRVTDAGRANPASQPTEFRADRATTAVWQV